MINSLLWQTFLWAPRHWSGPELSQTWTASPDWQYKFRLSRQPLFTIVRKVVNSPAFLPSFESLAIEFYFMNFSELFWFFKLEFTPSSRCRLKSMGSVDWDLDPRRWRILSARSRIQPKMEDPKRRKRRSGSLGALGISLTLVIINVIFSDAPVRFGPVLALYSGNLNLNRSATTVRFGSGSPSAGSGSEQVLNRFIAANNWPYKVYYLYRSKEFKRNGNCLCIAQ